ncbi:unnamed protein product [Dibothriocephalus latus]|uniref:Uncharacterized protein n=1 Tax=Dibothriocephalus latus TaxID=60516 RepID=A0A3P6UT68_DIBLA|nr:unnamed protein product [Dibothriocephalus latus]
MQKSSPKSNEHTTEIELDAELFPLRSKREELEAQIAEARRLQNDLDHTKSRLLSGLQHQFFVFTAPDEDLLMPKADGPKLLDVFSLLGDKGRSIRARHDADTEILEIEIADDQDIIDNIGEHLRLVSSLSP